MLPGAEVMVPVADGEYGLAAADASRPSRKGMFASAVIDVVTGKPKATGNPAARKDVTVSEVVEPSQLVPSRRK